MHLLTNAEMTLLIEDALAEEEPTAKGRRKRRDSATLRGDKLTEEQITQVGPETGIMASSQLLSCRKLAMQLALLVYGRRRMRRLQRKF